MRRQSRASSAGAQDSWFTKPASPSAPQSSVAPGGRQLGADSVAHSNASQNDPSRQVESSNALTNLSAPASDALSAFDPPSAFASAAPSSSAPSAASASSPVKTSIWSRTFVTLCIVNLFQVIGQQMMGTIIPLYAREMGAPAAMIGFVVGSFAVTALCIRPFASPAFDSFSKKKIFFGAILILMLCSFLYGYAHNVPALIAVRMLHGIAMGCTGPLALALVSETLPIEHMGSGISIFSLAQALSQAVGPALGLWLIGVIGFQWTFKASGISMIVAAVLVLTIRETLHPDRPKYRIALNRMFAAGAVPPAVCTTICSAANSSIMSFIAIYGGLLGIGQIGLYFTVHALCLLITRPFFGRLADRLGYIKIIVPALCVYALGFLIISQATQLWMFLAAAVLTACGYGVCSPLFQAIAMASVPRKRSGAASSTNFTGLDAAQLVGPTMAGSFAGHFQATTGSEVDGYSYMYLAIIVLIGLAVVACLSTRKLMDRNMAKAAAANAQEAK